jgi:hypothetical protein
MDDSAKATVPSNAPPASHAEVIDAFGGPAAYAEAVGIPDSHARAMKARDSISPAYWRPTAGAARVRGISGITFERLAEIAALAAESRLAVNDKVAGVAS